MQILIIVLIGFGLYKLFSRKYKPCDKPQNFQSAQDRLNERFVNGEIDEETYKKIKETIGK